MSNGAVPFCPRSVLGVIVVSIYTSLALEHWTAFIGIPESIHVISIRRHLSVIRASFSVTEAAEVSRGLGMGKDDVRIAFVSTVKLVKHRGQAGNRTAMSLWYAV